MIKRGERLGADQVLDERTNDSANPAIHAGQLLVFVVDTLAANMGQPPVPRYKARLSQIAYICCRTNCMFLEGENEVKERHQRSKCVCK